jgi:hypothetical protein
VSVLFTAIETGTFPAQGAMMQKQLFIPLTDFWRLLATQFLKIIPKFRAHK